MNSPTPPVNSPTPPVNPPIAPWPRPSFQATDRSAAVTLISFADEDVLADGVDLGLNGNVPQDVPAEALDLRVHHYADAPAWVDGWRTGALRDIAAEQLGDLHRLDAAKCCYSITVEIADPADLTHLQLAWAVAAALAEAGSFATLDAYACNWFPGAALAALPPSRPFVIQQEVSLIAESEPSRKFGHAVHTRGMIKFGRPDLVAGVPADRIEETGRILNQVAQLLAEGHVLAPGQELRFEGSRPLAVKAYRPDRSTPDLNLNNEALLLIDA